MDKEQIISKSLIDDYLQRLEIDKKIRESGVYFATDLVKPCMLNVYYGIKEETTPSKKQLRVYESGNILEDFWINSVLRNTPGIQVLATQLPARYMGEDFSIHGRIDCLVLEAGKLVIYEVKTAKTSSWMTREKQDHYLQLNFYLNCLCVDFGKISYIDKSIMLLGEDPKNPTLPPDTNYPVERNRADFDYLIETAKTLHIAVSTETPPAPKPCWLCEKNEMYCDYYNKCPIYQTPQCKSLEGVESVNEEV